MVKPRDPHTPLLGEGDVPDLEVTAVLEERASQEGPPHEEPNLPDDALRISRGSDPGRAIVRLCARCGGADSEAWARRELWRAGSDSTEALVEPGEAVQVKVHSAGGQVGLVVHPFEVGVPRRRVGKQRRKAWQSVGARVSVYLLEGARARVEACVPTNAHFAKLA